MSAFVKYLESLKVSLDGLGPTSDLHLTFGNESCDLDSIASALVYAHCKSIVLTRDSPETVSLPLVQCRREDLLVNQVAVYLFDLLGIDASAVVCLDDVSSDVLSAVGNLSLVMVDHNTPTGIFGSLSSNVVRVIDHHQVTTDSIADKDSVSATVEMVGSCASLVAREVLEDGGYTVEESVAMLLLSAILLDTGNMKALERVTSTDEFIVKELTKILPSSFNREEHYRSLYRARFDLSSLSIKQVLQMDYKNLQVDNYTIGFSTVTALLSDFLSHPDLNSHVLDFYSGHKLDAFVIVGVLLSDSSATTLRRQLAVVQPRGISSEFSESIATLLEVSSELQCVRTDQAPAFNGVLFEQGNVQLSRKHIMPIVNAFLASVESEDLKSDLSPSRVVLEHITPAAILATASEPSFPLEPSITILNTPERDFPAERASPAERESPSGRDLAPRDETTEPSTVSGSRTGVRSAPRPPPGTSETRAIPEYTSAEEFKERRSHRYVSVGGEETIISMDLVQPYKKIIQHAGYIGESRQALVIISACHLPPRGLPNYDHVVHHTFYYILSVLDQLIVEDYTIVYFHSGAPRNSMPSMPIFHKFYKTIDRRLRKQLTQLFIVHPTFWVKTMLHLARPFISKKFWRKLHFIATLQDLSVHVKVDESFISAPVAAMDKVKMSQRPTSQKYMTRHQDSQGKAADKKDHKEEGNKEEVKEDSKEE